MIRKIKCSCQPIECYPSGMSHKSDKWSQLIDGVLEYRRKMHHCITLHVNSQYIRSVLQKEIIHLFSLGWVSQGIPIHHVFADNYPAKPPPRRDKNTLTSSINLPSTAVVRANFECHVRRLTYPFHSSVPSEFQGRG